MADDSDRRQEPRQRVVRAAITVVEGSDGPAGALPCVVLDISKSGARLHVHSPTETPDRFQLVVESENSSHRCEVVWRRDNEVGVKFVD